MSQANAAYSQTRALVSAANEFHLARRAQREAAQHDGASERANANRGANYYGRKARRKFNRA